MSTEIEARDFSEMSDDEAADMIESTYQNFKVVEAFDRAIPVEIIGYAALHYAYEYALRKGASLDDVSQFIREANEEFAQNFDPSIILFYSKEVH